jgi:hypothetical protein
LEAAMEMASVEGRGQEKEGVSGEGKESGSAIK